ncbi:MAG: MFS transporter, partial [Verrucomicrobiota bacterium]
NTPTREVFSKYRAPVLRVALLNVGLGVGFYTVFVYAVTFLEQVSQLSEKKALRNNSIAMVLLLVIMPLAARWADRHGRKVVLGVGFSLLAVTAIPLFHVMGLGIRWVTIGCEMALAVPLGLVAGAIAATNVELMPREVRCTGLAFAYNLSVGVFGGLTPMVVTWLTAYLKNPAAPGFWVAGTAAVSALTLFCWIQETREAAASGPPPAAEASYKIPIP